MNDTARKITRLEKLSAKASNLGAGGALRDTLEAIVIEAADQLLHEAFEAGNARVVTANQLCRQIVALAHTLNEANASV